MTISPPAAARFRRAAATLLTLSAALAGLLVGVPATAGATTTTTSAAQVVDSCNQKPAVGHYSCYAERRTDLGYTTRRAMISAQATPYGYGPSQLQRAYNLTAAAAASSTQRVYIVDAYDDPTAESDLAVYRSQYGLPACTTANGCFRKLNQSGTTSPLPKTDTGWAGEIALDLQLVSAVCPHCGITLMEATDSSDNLFTAVKKATSLGAKFVSMSWGGPEAGDESTYDRNYFATPGVVYAAATGDDGYAGKVIYPATSPKVVAVGGTSLRTSSNSRGWAETAWSGAGSGCSSDETKSSWQSVVPSSACTHRADSDVSAVADPNTGVAVYDTTGGSGWTVYGGTSAATPIIAATYALAGTPATDNSPVSLPYAQTGGLNDVTSGNNGSCSATVLCTARAGWDGPTGLGTPNGISAFTSASSTDPSGSSNPSNPANPANPANTVTLTTPGAQRSTVGTAARLQLTATDSGGAAVTYSASGLPAGLTLNASTGLISGTPAKAGTSQVSVAASDSTGGHDSATFTWTVAAPPSACATTVIGNPGFESGVNGWKASGGVVQRSATMAHNGTHLARLDGYGRTHHDTLTRTITVPAGCRATLRYYLWVASSDTGRTAHDKLYVSAAGHQLTAFTNLNRGRGYVLRTASLSAFAGKSFTLSFSGYENSSLATAFRVDDISVTLSV